jgi:hypothetical protein
MTDHIGKWAWAQTDIPPTAKFVLLAMAFRAKGVFVSTNLAVLMEDTGLPLDDVSDGIRRLGAAGLLRKMHTDDGVAYYLNLPQKKRDGPKPTAATAPKEDIDKALGLYNDMALRCHLPKVKKMTKALATGISNRLAEHGINGWIEALDAIEVSAFCRGLNDRGWKADLTFVCQAKSFARLINGSYGADYEEKSHGGRHTSLGGRGDDRTDRLRRIVTGPDDGSFERGGRGGSDHEDHADAGSYGGSPAGRLIDHSALGSDD